MFVSFFFLNSIFLHQWIFIDLYSYVLFATLPRLYEEEEKTETVLLFFLFYQTSPVSLVLCRKTCLSEKSSKPISHFFFLFIWWPLKTASMIECVGRREEIEGKKGRRRNGWRYLCGLKTNRMVSVFRSKWVRERERKRNGVSQYSIKLLEKNSHWIPSTFLYDSIRKTNANKQIN